MIDDHATPAGRRTSQRRTSQRRTPRRAAAVVVVALLLSALATGGAGAQEPLTTEELGLRTTVAYGADVHSAGWLPVEIRLAPTRLFGGTLSVLSEHDGGRLVEQIPVEVAAGSEKVYRFVVPPAHQLQVRVDEDGRAPLTTRVDASRRGGTSFLVGVLGAPVPQQTPLVSSIASELTPSYVSIDPAWLVLSPRALDGVGAVVVAQTALRELGEDARASLVQAVAAGLDLTVTVDRAGQVDLGLPWTPVTAASSVPLEPAGSVLGLETAGGAWTLTVADLPGDDSATVPADSDTVVAAAVTAGRGRVTVVGAALGGEGLGTNAALWSQLLQPGSHLAESMEDSGTWRSTSVANETLRSQGLSLPSLPWLGGFLLAYVLLVGPLNGFVLSRIGRRELAWLTIPAVTVVFATGAYAGASGAQPPVGLTATAGVWIDGVGQQIAVTGARSPREGVHTTTFGGDGWSVLPATQTSTPARIDRTRGDTSVALDLGSLQVGTLIGWRATDAAAPLEVTAVAEDDAALVVTVTNRGAVTVEDITVHAATATRGVGSLASGESTEVRFAGFTELPTREPWQDEFQGMRGRDGTADAPRSLEALLRFGVLDGNPGTVFAVGITEASVVPLPTIEGDAEDLGSLVAVGVTPTVDATDQLTPAAVQRALLPVAGQGFGRPSSLAVESSGRALLRYRLPAGVEPATLVSTLDHGFDQFGGGFGGGEGMQCFSQPMFDEQGNVIGEQEVCEEMLRPQVEPAEPPAVPPCPPDAECSLDGQLFEICRELEGGVRECQVQVVGPELPRPDLMPPGPRGEMFSIEVYDHVEGSWRFLGEVVQVHRDGTATLDPDRFVGPLGEVFVRASGELFPFDFSGRGLGATLGGTT